MRLTVEELREKYPDPIRSLEHSEMQTRIDDDGLTVFSLHNNHEYCVGGALVKELDRLSENLMCGCQFPPVREVAFALHALGVKDWETAHDIAEKLVEANDTGNFDEAWAWLDKGLSYQEEE